MHYRYEVVMTLREVLVGDDGQEQQTQIVHEQGVYKNTNYELAKQEFEEIVQERGTS